MKLEQIPKKPVFSVPDRYFEELPGRIQSRISSKVNEPNPFWKYKLQYALPVLLGVVISAIWIFSASSEETAEQMLASVDTEQLVAYLNTSDLTMEDMLDEVDFNSADIEDIEAEVYKLQLDDDIPNEMLDEF